MHNSAYQATEEDLANVLSSNWADVANSEGKSFKTMAAELFPQLDFDLIEQSALFGDALEQQTDYANDEITRQLRAMGVLEEPRQGEPGAYHLTDEQVLRAIDAHDLRTYEGWLAAAAALLADAPEWTAIQDASAGLYVAKVAIDGKAGIFSLAEHADPSALYSVDECGDFDSTAWNGQAWDGVPVEQNLRVLQKPVFVHLKHAA